MRIRFVALVLGLLAASAAPAAATAPPGAAGPVVFNFSDGAAITGDLYLMNADGGDRRPLSTTPGGVADSQAQFSADGRTVFFKRSGAIEDIFSINVDGSGLRNVTNATAASSVSDPAPSPDGKLVAFDESVMSEFDIWVVRPDGTAPVNLTNTPVVDEGSPSFSPDGRLIVFSRCEDLCEIWVMNADGTNPRPVGTGGFPFEDDPEFSRDGKRIAFEVCPGSDCDIGVINLDGSGRTDFANPGDENSPSFTADGRIGFTDCDASGNNCDIATLPVSGGTPTLLSPTPQPVMEIFPDFHAVQSCGKREATIVGDDGPDTLKGSKRGDVIDANLGKNKVNSGGGNDTICAGKKARINCGGGKKDRVIGKYKKAKNCERGKGL